MGLQSRVGSCHVYSSTFIHQRAPPPHRPRPLDKAPPNDPHSTPRFLHSPVATLPSSRRPHDPQAERGAQTPPPTPLPPPPRNRAAPRGLPTPFGRPAPPSVPLSPERAPGMGDGGEAPRPPHSAPPLPASPPAAAAAILGKEPSAERLRLEEEAEWGRGSAESVDGRHVVVWGWQQCSPQAHTASLSQPPAPGGCLVRGRCPSYPCLRGGSFLSVHVSQHQSPSLITTS